jgi:hypothetical protein
MELVGSAHSRNSMVASAHSLSSRTLQKLHTAATFRGLREHLSPQHRKGMGLQNGVGMHLGLHTSDTELTLKTHRGVGRHYYNNGGTPTLAGPLDTPTSVILFFSVAVCTQRLHVVRF